MKKEIKLSEYKSFAVIISCGESNVIGFKSTKERDAFITQVHKELRGSKICRAVIQPIKVVVSSNKEAGK